MGKPLAPTAPRAQAAIATRDRLVRIARRVFALKGYDGAPLRDIARTAGYSTGGVFAHFTGKPDLYAAAMGVAHDEPERFLRRLAAFDVEDLADPRDRDLRLYLIVINARGIVAAMDGADDQVAVRVAA